MAAREFVLPSFGVSCLARFERIGEDMGLHISDSFTSDARKRKFDQNMHVCAENRTMIVLKPVFLGWEILRLGRRWDEGFEVSNMFRWGSPSLFGRGDVKGMQGMHENFEGIGRKEERCRIRHGHILESLKK